MNLLSMSVSEMANLGFQCTCGKKHEVNISEITIGKECDKALIQYLKSSGYNKINIIEDINTHKAQGAMIEARLKDEFIISKYIFPEEHLIPDEKALGRLIVEIDMDTDVLIAIGSGTINDLTRYLSYKLNKPYIVVGTAPSMDGYASVVSPLIVNGVKTTFNAVYPEAIFGELDILSSAPKKMLNAGFGDIIGKYNALADWELARILLDEYYCESIVSLVKKAIDKCTDSGKSLKDRGEASIKNIMDSLILTGICIGMAGCSRPASGEEHHLSHCWEMQSIEDGTYGNWLHGNNVGVGTMVVIEAHKFIKNINITEIHEHRQYLELDATNWKNNIKSAYGVNEENVIKFKESKIVFDKTKREENFLKIYENWDEIQKISEKLILDTEKLTGLMELNEAPSKPQDLGLSKNQFYYSLICAKDIRDRYGVFQMLEDIGVLEEAAKYITDIYYK